MNSSSRRYTCRKCQRKNRASRLFVRCIKCPICCEVNLLAAFSQEKIDQAVRRAYKKSFKLTPPKNDD